MFIRYLPKFNFHNASPINVRITASQITDYDGDHVAILSASQAKRIQKHFCGITDCRCNGGQLIPVDNDTYAIAIPE